MPKHLAIRTAGSRLAVPLATLSKRNLKRFDAKDSAGTALSVWGREQNGRLAAEALTAGFVAAFGHDSLGPEQTDAIERVVFARSRQDAEPHLERLFAAVPPRPQDESTADLGVAVRALAETLAGAFLLVVEVADDAIDRRVLIKIGYDDDRLGQNSDGARALGGRLEVPLEVRDWSSAASWHLEVRAPSALSIAELEYFVSESDLVVAEGSDGGQASTAHVAGSAVPLGADTDASVALVPQRAGLVNQVMIGVLASLGILVGVLVGADAVGSRLGDLERPASLAPLILSLPAVLLAALARAPEHQLISRVLLVPRLVSFASAVVLWVAAGVLIWTTEPESIRCAFTVLTLLQAGLVAWISSIWSVSGRG